MQIFPLFFSSSTMTVRLTHRESEKGHSLVSQSNYQLWPCWGNTVMVLIKTVPGVKSGIQSKILTVCRDQGREKALAGTQQSLPLTSGLWVDVEGPSSFWFFSDHCIQRPYCQLQNCKVSGPLTQGVKHLVLMSFKPMFPQRKSRWSMLALSKG